MACVSLFEPSGPVASRGERKRNSSAGNGAATPLANRGSCGDQPSLTRANIMAAKCTARRARVKPDRPELFPVVRAQQRASGQALYGFGIWADPGRPDKPRPTCAGPQRRLALPEMRLVVAAHLATPLRCFCCGPFGHGRWGGTSGNAPGELADVQRRHRTGDDHHHAAPAICHPCRLAGCNAASCVSSSAESEISSSSQGVPARSFFRAS